MNKVRRYARNFENMLRCLFQFTVTDLSDFLNNFDIVVYHSVMLKVYLCDSSH